MNFLTEGYILSLASLWPWRILFFLVFFFFFLPPRKIPTMGKVSSFFFFLLSWVSRELFLSVLYISVFILSSEIIMGYLNLVRIIRIIVSLSKSSLMAQLVKIPPAMWEIWVPSLGREAPLEEGVATHSSILAWKIPMDRGAWRATFYGVKKSQT